MRIGVVTLFPEMFDAVTCCGVTGRAVKRGLLELKYWNPRDNATDRHKTVDDRPYGGGPGMVMRVSPLAETIRTAKEGIGARCRVICLTPQGRRLNQSGVEGMAAGEGLVLVSGRYEGIDERIIETEIDEEWSIGDYVLSGGELAAMVIIDAVARHLPGVLGHEDSVREDSFANGLLDCPHYTRPEEWQGRSVPEVLLEGNHAEIRRWRLKQSLGRTWLRRRDMLVDLDLDDEQRALLEEFIYESR
ncbi:MAG: tRNA (guanosine(37)-N1)-methyltransferase TrmD [Gammaproteobacteria bacterium]|nr:tRNA (guanosine(37)-N1)-methyltransferase TrmD [Gammaproteobacteria bacterium]